MGGFSGRGHLGGGHYMKIGPSVVTLGHLSR